MNNQINKNNGQTPANEDDFSASMAKLTELATKDLGPEKPKENKNLIADDQVLTEFMKPKRKVKPKTYKDKWTDKTIKIKINPYVASGIMIVLLSVSIIAAPKISAYLNEQEISKQIEKEKIAQLSKNTEDKLKSYSVFDAAKDVSGENTELKIQSVAELARSVKENNLLLAQKEKEAAQSQLALNVSDSESTEFGTNLSDEQSDFNLTEDYYKDESFYSLIEPDNSETNWYLSKINLDFTLNFKFQNTCPIVNDELPGESGILYRTYCY